MISVCITGGIGSGKSIVCNIFRQLQVPVYDADYQAKKLYEIEQEIPERIKNEISENVFDKKGKLDKQKLSSVVFQDESALMKLNKIVHPYVISDFEDWKKKYNEVSYILKESAILFESGVDKGCDKIICVSAPKETRLQRTMLRDKRSREEVEQIMQRQWSDEEREIRADFIINNNENELVIPQVLDIHNKLLLLSKS